MLLHTFMQKKRIKTKTKNNTQCSLLAHDEKQSKTLASREYYFPE